MRIDFIPDTGLYPFESRWFDSSVGRVHYVDEGRGRPLLFCHGSPTWSFLYRDVIAALRGDFRCVAVDLPGFGLSDRPSGFGYTIAEITDVVEELVDHLDLRDLVVVGQDWGGPVGLGVAARRPERIGGLALTNTALWPIDAMPNRIFSAVMSSTPMQRRILRDGLLVEKVLLGRAGPELSEAEADHYRAVQATPEARAALAVMPREIRSAGPLLARLQTDVARLLGDRPAVAVWGMRDRVFPGRSCIPRLRRMFDELTVVELPDAGHLVPEDAPDRLVDAIAARFGRP